MSTTLYDLQAAEAHWHDLQTEAEHERLVTAALKTDPHRTPTTPGRLIRYLAALGRRRPLARPDDPRKN